MADVFLSYARSTERQAQAAAAALRALGYSVWFDEDLPSHRAYADVIEEQIAAARALLVIWSADAARSQWVRSEADYARQGRKLVQLSVEAARLPMPFDQIQCADLVGWDGDPNDPAWRRVVASLAALVSGPTAPDPRPAAAAPALRLPDKPSIAVLPFTNLGADPGETYFADGMVEEIVAALARNRSIFVIAAGSSLTFKGQDVGVGEAARRLGVRYVLEGSVRRSADRVRVSVKLSDAADGAQIWSERFDDTLDDVFALQDRVALGAAGAIEPAVVTAEIRRATVRPTVNMSSYELFLRALSKIMTFEPGDLIEGLKFALQAVALDPNYARAMVLAGFCESFISLSPAAPDPPEHRRRALELARRALQLAPDDAEVASWAAMVLWQTNDDMDTAIALIDRALVLNPGYSPAWMNSGLLRNGAGDPERAAEHMRTAMRLDPLSSNRPVQLTGLGISHMMRQQFPQAIALFKESAQLRASYPTNYAMLAACYGHAGQFDAARAAIAQFEASTGGVPIRAWPPWMGPQAVFDAGISLVEAAPSTPVKNGEDENKSSPT